MAGWRLAKKLMCTSCVYGTTGNSRAIGDGTIVTSTLERPADGRSSTGGEIPQAGALAAISPAGGAGSAARARHGVPAYPVLTARAPTGTSRPLRRSRRDARQPPHCPPAALTAARALRCKATPTSSATRRRLRPHDARQPLTARLPAARAARVPRGRLAGRPLQGGRLRGRRGGDVSQRGARPQGTRARRCASALRHRRPCSAQRRPLLSSAAAPAQLVRAPQAHSSSWTGLFKTRRRASSAK